ncbi:MAG: 4a-hydroxytetrahydrobiopterin dehydratase [Leptothrix sp. (in: Bacteria)]|nr:4a-hydroxytetrahydrobiopterin dehydratase [Leptothrix sp. (in: b-proteobacteria)]
MNDLARRRCQPLEGQPAMAAADIAAHLADAPGWSLVDGAIQKHFDFPDYHRTMAFVNALAWVAHRQDHHPELVVTYGRCTVRLDTHSVGGISINDFICAAQVDALLP